MKSKSPTLAMISEIQSNLQTLNARMSKLGNTGEEQRIKKRVTLVIIELSQAKNDFALLLQRRGI